MKINEYRGELDKTNKLAGNMERGRLNLYARGLLIPY